MLKIKIIDPKEKLLINYSFVQTAFGKALLAATGKGLCFAGFAENENDGLKELKKRFPKAEFTEKSDTFQKEALKAFENQDIDLILHLKGTDFQLNVWRELLKIPRGKTTTYSAIAAQLNNPNAARAVGTAIGQNPVSVIIPCHRVVRADGSLGGYHWGLECKKKILSKEMT